MARMHQSANQNALICFTASRYLVERNTSKSDTSGGRQPKHNSAASLKALEFVPAAHVGPRAHGHPATAPL